jgi:hypothetical protein
MSASGAFPQSFADPFRVGMGCFSDNNFFVDQVLRCATVNHAALKNLYEQKYSNKYIARGDSIQK